jgi:hypothetical protein
MNDAPDRYKYLPDAELVRLLRSLARTTRVAVGNRTEDERVAILLGAAARLDEIDRSAR